MASYMIFSAVLFLPPYIIMLTNFATIRLAYLDRQDLRLAAPPDAFRPRLRLRLLGSILRPALLPACHARRVERAAMM